MERLLKDAEKLSGIKYNIDNFSDIIAAIHVIQEQQGIAGTTAKEAATTISGSIGMVKGAWANLLSGLGDENQDVGKLVSNLTDSVLTAADNIVPRLQTMAPRIVSAVQTIVATLGPQLPDILGSVLPGLIEAATTLITGLADVLPDLMGAIIDVLPTVFSQIGAAMQKLFPALGQTIQKILGKINFNGLGQSIGNGLKSIVTNLPNILSSIGNAIRTGWSTIVYPLISGLFSAAFGIELPKWSDVVDDITDLWNEVKTGIAGFFQWLFGIDTPEAAKVQETIENLWNDVKTLVGNALSVAWHLLPPAIRQAVNTVKNWWSSVTSGLNLTVGYTAAPSGTHTSAAGTTFGGGGKDYVDSQTAADIQKQVSESLRNNSRLNLINAGTPLGTMNNPTYGGTTLSPYTPHASGAIFSKPTLFDTASGYHLVGEAGAEAVAPISVLQGYVKSAVNEVVGNSMERKLDQMLTALQEGFGGMNQPIVLDSGVLVGATAGMMDKRLGRMAARKGRNA